MRAAPIFLGGTFLAVALALTTCDHEAPPPPQNPPRPLLPDTYTISHVVLFRSEADASDNTILANITAGSCVQPFADSDGSQEYLEVRLMMDGTPRDGWVHKRYLNPNAITPNPCAGALSPYTPPAQ